ncbi:hypothetical protein COT63_01845 [Candidatus Shapirobacteria bacterium CG09_land_8_20_14_0_10_38_17]|uniref:Type II secretion system protein GspF domain-containing protein n=1 Tax=Candidatus Shapirobacteria bacterium CG09_land_8_20_14_0_10_38_17 TaxID=1974884 RepID=A0A2H0WR02_9BACT|nr:MAG: hypothetical protein COT63_01845 [Candidatus Shapirobacteria bacterium CG09_land_8_20_14_0_10_38_17]
MEFSYQVKDQDGKTIKGIVEADTQDKAISLLKERGLFVVSIREGKGWTVDLSDIQFWGKVSQDEVTVFTRQLSTMINAGLPINDALFALKEQVSSKFAQVVDEVLRQVEGGKGLGKALEGWPDIFNQAYISSVQSGEAAGVLDKVLLRLASDMEEEKEFRGNIKGAMIYPLIVVVAMIIVAAIMMVVVIPKMTSLYSELGADLPGPTKILMAVSSFAARFWWILLLMSAGLVYGFFAFQKTEKGAEAIDRLILKLPVIGSLQEKTALSNVTRTLGLLLGTGVSLVEALNIVADVAGNSVFAKAIKSAAQGVEKGRPLSQMLSLSGVFPPIFYQMTAVGEGTGKLDETLEKVSIYFKGEAEVAVKGLTSAIEPIIMIILGLGVGFLVIAVIMPIYNLTSQF